MIVPSPSRGQKGRVYLVKIVVLAGGLSMERNVSLSSGIMVTEALRERGIPTIVWLTPILPFINDTEENITAILSACARAGVSGVIDFGMGLTLRDGSREYYYAALDRHFPGMKERYIARYGNAYELPSPNAGKLTEVFRRICRENGMLSRPEDCFRFMEELPEKYPQISLFDT